jgi:transcriptional regulator with XRE-family HTH domain
MSTKSTKKYQYFSEALKTAIENSMFQQGEIAEKMNKDDAQISRYVNGKITPRKSTIKELQEVLGVKFIKVTGGWVVSTSSQKAINSIESVKDAIARYVESQPDRDDIAEVLESRDMLQELIDKLVS